jgi:hypothetical protein
MKLRPFHVINIPQTVRWILLGVVLIFITSQVHAAPCPKTATQKDTWVLQSINQLVTKARAAYEDEGLEKSYGRVLDRISRTLSHCRLSDDARFAERYPAFIEYVRVLSLGYKKGHELGFEVSDRTYFEETQSYVTIPEFLLTPQFLRAVRRSETLGQAKAMLRLINASRTSEDQLLFFSYESRHLGTPDNDNSFRRLLIVVPGDVSQNVPEKWVQFGIPDPGSKTPIRNMSVVAVVPGPGRTSNTYFKDYFRTYRRNGTITVKGRWELGYGDDNCVKCHKSGVLPIFPEEGSVSKDEKAVVEAVNQRFLTYGAPRFGGYLDASKLGPGLGSQPTAEALHSKPSVSCSGCHQPNGLGSLNWPMDPVLISSFVESGRMPFGAKLQPSESTALYQQLVDEYFAIEETRPGILKRWLLGQTNSARDATNANRDSK